MPLADRRLASRFEVVGKPWGSVEILEPLRVCNLSREGMLVESATPLAVGSVHEFQLGNGTVPSRTQTAVRHLSPAQETASGQWYLVGLEILTSGIQAAAQVEEALPDAPSPSAPAGPGEGHEFIERRRSPRAAAADGTMVVRPVSVPVRLLDLSSGGVLLACAEPARVVAAHRVTAGLAGRRLDVAVAIRHVSSRWDEDAGGYLVGGSFPSLDPPARHALNDLLSTSDPHAGGGPRSSCDRHRARTRARAHLRLAHSANWREQPQREPHGWLSTAT